MKCSAGENPDLPRHPEVLAKYQEAAKTQGIDPMGWALRRSPMRPGRRSRKRSKPPRALDQAAIAAWLRGHTVHTVVGDIAFGKDGEWAKSRVFFTQFQHVTGNSLDNFRDTTHEVVVWPNDYKTGDMIYPYAEAKKP